MDQINLINCVPSHFSLHWKIVQTRNQNEKKCNQWNYSYDGESVLQCNLPSGFAENTLPKTKQQNTSRTFMLLQPQDVKIESQVLSYKTRSAFIIYSCLSFQSIWQCIDRLKEKHLLFLRLLTSLFNRN